MSLVDFGLARDSEGKAEADGANTGVRTTHGCWPRPDQVALNAVRHELLELQRKMSERQL